MTYGQRYLPQMQTGCQSQAIRSAVVKTVSTSITALFLH